MLGKIIDKIRQNKKKTLLGVIIAAAYFSFGSDKQETEDVKESYKPMPKRVYRAGTPSTISATTNTMTQEKTDDAGLFAEPERDAFFDDAGQENVQPMPQTGNQKTQPAQTQGPVAQPQGQAAQTQGQGVQPRGQVETQGQVAQPSYQKETPSQSNQTKTKAWKQTSYNSVAPTYKTVEKTVKTANTSGKSGLKDTLNGQQKYQGQKNVQQTEETYTPDIRGPQPTRPYSNEPIGAGPSHPYQRGQNR